MTLVVRHRIKLMAVAVVLTLIGSLMLDDDCDNSRGGRYVGSTVVSTR